MHRNRAHRARQQSLGFDPDDARGKLSASAREECRELLTELLIHVVQTERTQEDEDE
jgi:hypothetical protein